MSVDIIGSRDDRPPNFSTVKMASHIVLNSVSCSRRTIGRKRPLWIDIVFGLGGDLGLGVRGKKQYLEQTTTVTTALWEIMGNYLLSYTKQFKMTQRSIVVYVSHDPLVTVVAYPDTGYVDVSLN